VWRVWTGPDGSVYQSVRNISGVFKASLHPRGWRIAFTKLSDPQRLAMSLPPPDRAIDKFPPSTELAPGVRRGIVVLVPSFSVSVSRSGERSDGDIHWVAPAPTGHVVEVTTVLTSSHTSSSPDDWPGNQSMGTQFVGRLPLLEGGTAWLVSRLVQPPASVLDRWTAHQVSLAPAGQARAGANSDLRGFLIGHFSEDGCRFFVDLKFPDAPSPGAERHHGD